MNLAPAQLQEHLKRGLKSLYTLHGDEPLLVQEFADALRAAAREQGYTERTVHTVAGAHFDWSEVLASGGSLSLFADKQIVEIRIPSGKPGKDGSVALQQIAERAQGDDSTLTLVMLPRLDSMTAKGAWFGALDSFGVTVKFDPIDRAACRSGLPSACSSKASAWPPAKKASARCSFLPTGWKATCWPRTRKSRSWACCTRRNPAAATASSASTRSKTPCSMWRATTSSSSLKPCWAANRCAWRACSTACSPKASPKCWCTGRWPKTSAA
jgi:hypothetical protein